MPDLIKSLDRRTRKAIARIFPGRFPSLYSTLDDPQRVPVQEAAYRLAADRYLKPDDSILDVGFGLGYGLKIMAGAGRQLTGVEIDHRAVTDFLQRQAASIPGLQSAQVYDGLQFPFADQAFDVVVCVDVIEHVPDERALLLEMLRVARRLVLVSTPNRRPEFTRPNGRPRNPWHFREWTFEEFDQILSRLSGVRIEWNCLDGPTRGPFRVLPQASSDTYALTPVLWKE